MRKVLAVFLILTVLSVLAACNKKEPETTTTLPETTTKPTTTEAQPMSYVLTTNPEKTVPDVSATRFEISAAPSVPSNDVSVNVNIDVTGSGDPERPDVNMGVAPTVSTTLAPSRPSSVSSTPSSNSGSDISDNQTTEAPKKKAVSLSINSEASNSDSEQIILEIDNSVWSGDIKANTQNISVEVDGVKLDGTVPLKVASKKNADGNQEIVIDLSGKGISSGTTVSFTIPEGFLQTSNGAQYNSTYPASAAY